MRAQYTEQAHALRMRIELNVSRIPKELRNMKIKDIIAQHDEQQRMERERAAGVADVRAAVPVKQSLKRNRYIYPKDTEIY